VAQVVKTQVLDPRRATPASGHGTDWLTVVGKISALGRPEWECLFAAIGTIGSKQRDTLIISLLVARVLAVADQPYPAAFVDVRPIDAAAFIQTHGRDWCKADDPTAAGTVRRFVAIHR
jgi:hypothetical protein